MRGLRCRVQGVGCVLMTALETCFVWRLSCVEEVQEGCCFEESVSDVQLAVCWRVHFPCRDGT